MPPYTKLPLDDGGDEYLSEAAKFSALTECETDPGKRAEFANLSRAYLRLALQAKGYSHTDIIYEPPLPRLDHQK
jgi:hypothetical protein